MSNLLAETESNIESSQHTPAQVAWVGSRNGRHAVSWEDFVRIANIDYDSGYGGQEIASDLVVVFMDGSWLERSEYDGAEEWSYNKTPVRRDDAQPFTTVKNGDFWSSVAEMNRPGGKYGQ